DACPEEAIIMSRETEICAYNRDETIWDLKRLTSRPELKEFGLGYRPNQQLVDSRVAFVPIERVQKKLTGRVTMKEKATMIPHVTSDPNQDGARLAGRVRDSRRRILRHSNGTGG